MMDQEGFWQLIDDARAESDGNMDEQLAALVSKLSAETPDEIVAFQRMLDEHMALSYRWDLWAAGYIINGGCSDDGFDYFRAWLIMQGKSVFFDALNDPDTLVDVAGPDVAEFEPLLSAAWNAYEQRTGAEIPLDILPPQEPVGARWDDDDDLERMYPRLCAKFWTK
jgi:hypothetical protein